MDVELSVATLNTWGLPGLTTWPPRRLRYPRIRRWLEEGRFDLVALQEVWAPVPRGAGRVADHPILPPESAASGLAIVTLLPVARTLHRSYGLGANPIERRVHRKGVFLAVIEPVAGVQVTVATTHLQAHAGESDARVRAQQVELLLDLLDEIDGPILLMGDLNLHRGSATDRATLARLEHAGFNDAVAPFDRTPTYHVRGKRERFDRILLRDGGGVALWCADAHVERYREGERHLPLLADHRPVEARIRVSARVAAQPGAQ